LRRLVVTHLNKAKALASAGITIGDNGREVNLSDLSKKIEKILFGRLVG